MTRILFLLLLSGMLGACASMRHVELTPEPQVLLFDSDQAALKPASIAYLDRLSEFLECHEDYKVVIEGFTDSTASNEYNMKLSLRRAQVVQAYLVAKGLAPERTTIAAFGEDRPADDNKTSTGRQLNRRVVVTPMQEEKPVVYIPVAGPPRFNYTSTDPKIAGEGHNSGIRPTHR